MTTSTTSKRKRRALYLLGGLLIILLGATALYQRGTRPQPLSEEIFRDLFGKNAPHFTATCEIDLLGGGSSGSRYDFYEYHAEGAISVDSLAHYPSFSPSIYEVAKSGLANMSRSTWHETPILPKDVSVYDAFAKSMNLLTKDCSRAFVEADAVHKSGSYYAYMWGYPTGTWFYVYQPSSGKLTIIRSRG